jgi:two-component system, LuxR family, response regulator FixJ
VTTNKSVLIVEDDAAVRDSLCTLLESAGVKARAFASAEDFLRETPAVTGACLLLDLCLPGASGFDLLRTLDKSDFDLPVVIMTAHSHLAKKACDPAIGAFAVIEKPLNEENFFKIVEAAIDKAN